MAFSATLTPDPGPDFARLARFYGSQTVYEAIGASVSELAVTHLARRDQAGNKNGWPRTHFWEGIARGVRDKVDPNGVTIVFPYPMRAKVLGATIVPVRSKYLTIPMNAEAYGKRAREFSGLKFAVVPGIGAALVTDTPEAVLMYRLVRRAVLPPDPHALPAEGDIAAAARRALDEIDPG
jgi:hypothetical protein